MFYFYFLILAYDVLRRHFSDCVNELHSANFVVAQLVQAHQNSLEAAATTVDVNLGRLSLALSEELLRQVSPLLCELVIFLATGEFFAVSVEGLSRDGIGESAGRLDLGVNAVDDIRVHGEE